MSCSYNLQMNKERLALATIEDLVSIVYIRRQVARPSTMIWPHRDWPIDLVMRHHLTVQI